MERWGGDGDYEETMMSVEDSAVSVIEVVLLERRGGIGDAGGDEHEVVIKERVGDKTRAQLLCPRGAAGGPAAARLAISRGRSLTCAVLCAYLLVIITVERKDREHPRFSASRPPDGRPGKHIPCPVSWISFSLRRQYSRCSRR